MVVINSQVQLSYRLKGEQRELAGTRQFESGYVRDRREYYVTRVLRYRNPIEEQAKYFRRHDAEVKLLDFVAYSLCDICDTQDQYFAAAASAQGVINIYSTTVGPCGVCRDVIDAFRQEFRRVTVVVRYREPDSGIGGMVGCKEGASVSKCGYGNAQWVGADRHNRNGTWERMLTPRG